MEVLPFLGNVHRPECISSESVNIAEFSQSCQKAIEPHIVSTYFADRCAVIMSKALSLPQGSVEELRDVCSMDLLVCENEPDLSSLRPPSVHQWDNLRKISVWEAGCSDDIDEAAAKKLVSLGVQKQRLHELETDKGRRAIYFASHRFSRELMTDAGELPYSRVLIMNGFSPAEIVLRVRVYDPPSHGIYKSCGARPRSHMSLHFSQEITCLGSGVLTSLRDLISCQSDQLVTNSCILQSTTPRLAKDVYPGSFFCIDGNFYVDKRHADCDYSEEIRQWAESRGLGERPALDMAETKFSDLSIRVGYPYLYVHQIDCRHLIVFSDIRLLHHTDNLKLQHPRIFSTVRRDYIICGVCGRYAARWLTADHEISPSYFLYFCKRCYRSLNFSDGNRKQFDFEAYPLLVPTQIPRL